MLKPSGRPNLILDEHGIPAILSGPFPHELARLASTIPANETEEQRDAREKQRVSKLSKQARYIGIPRFKAPWLTLIQRERIAQDPDLHAASKWYVAESRTKAYVHHDAEWTDWGMDFGKSGTTGEAKVVASMRVLERWTDPKGITMLDVAEAVARMKEEARLRKLDESNRFAKRRKLSRDENELPDGVVEEMPGYKMSKTMPGVLVPLDWKEPEPVAKGVYTGRADKRPDAHIEPPDMATDDETDMLKVAGSEDEAATDPAGLYGDEEFSSHNLNADGFLEQNKPAIEVSHDSDGNDTQIEANSTALLNGIPIVNGVPLVDDVRMVNGIDGDSSKSSVESSQTEQGSSEKPESPESATSIQSDSSSD